MKTRKLLFYLLAVLLGGCGQQPFIASNPLYNEKDITFEKNPLGCWEYENITLEITQKTNPPKSYCLTVTDEEKQKWLFDAFLLRLENKLFADISLKEPPCTIYNQQNLSRLYDSFPDTSIHTFVKIESINPRLIIKLFDCDTFENLFKNNSDTIEYELTNDYLLLNVSTEQLREFIIKHADNKRLFGKEFILSRKIPYAIDSNDNTKEEQEY